jgi:hypothetical protein
MIIRQKNYPDAYEAWAHYLKTHTVAWEGVSPYSKHYLKAGHPIVVPTLWPIDFDPAAYPPDDVDSSRGKVKR